MNAQGTLNATPDDATQRESRPSSSANRLNDGANLRTLLLRRGCGETGRRASFRYLWANPLGGSIPLIRMLARKEPAVIDHGGLIALRHG